MSTDTQAFEQFWNRYPRKVGKGAAAKAWSKATSLATVAQIMVGLDRYCAAIAGKDVQFTAHPGTWLNQQRWLDEHAAPASEGGSAPAQAADPGVIRQMQVTVMAQGLRDRLLERTRAELVPKLEEAAFRIKSTQAEVWSCLVAGSAGLGAKAWDLAVEEALGGQACPQAIKPTREDWINAKERVESRARHIRGAQELRVKTGVQTPSVAPPATQETLNEAR